MASQVFSAQVKIFRFINSSLLVFFSHKNVSIGSPCSIGDVQTKARGKVWNRFTRGAPITTHQKIMLNFYCITLYCITLNCIVPNLINKYY